MKTVDGREKWRALTSVHAYGCCSVCLQIVIESDRSAVQYASFFVHSQKPINASIVFDLSHEHLYVATLTKVLYTFWHNILVYRISARTRSLWSVKAKLHYTSWFGDTSELASVMEFGF